MSKACEATLLHTLDVIFSASMVLKAIEFCFFLHQEPMATFIVEQQSDVLFQSTVLFAQSESAYLASSSSHWRHISGHIQLCLVYISIHVCVVVLVSLSRLTHEMTRLLSHSL
jgi:hypothetical protein